MPRFYKSFYHETDLDVDIDDFLNACSSTDIDELIEALIEDGHISKKAKQGLYEPYSVSEAQFQEALDKLDGKWNLLTQEEEATILKIASRF